MDLFPWSLVLLSGFIHALWNLRAKQVSNRTLHLAVAYVSAGAVLFPAALAAGGLHIPEEALLPVVLSSLAEAMYVVALSRAYTLSSLTFVYPIARGSSPVWATAAGLLFFGEHLSAPGMAAVIAIAAGILAVGFKPEGGTVKALFLSLAVGFFTGCYTSLDRKAIEYTDVLSLLFWKFLIAGLILLITRARGRSLAAEIRRNLKTSAATGIFILAAYFLVVLAMKHSSLGYVAAGRESGIAFSVLLGCLILGERPGVLRLAGVLAILGGIVLLRLA